MEKYAYRETFEECNAEFKVDIKVTCPSIVKHVNKSILDNQQRHRDFVAIIKVIFIQLKL